MSWQFINFLHQWSKLRHCFVQHTETFWIVCRICVGHLWRNGWLCRPPICLFRPTIAGEAGMNVTPTGIVLTLTLTPVPLALTLTLTLTSPTRHDQGF